MGVHSWIPSWPNVLINLDVPLMCVGFCCLCASQLPDVQQAMQERGGWVCAVEEWFFDESTA
jgi:hypothetical protein